MKLLSRKAAATNEELFIERYDRLRSWSLQLVDHDHELAEDLLHDAFIQFTLSPVDVDAIQNLDGYLYGMLRNLHLSQVRRATRHRFQQLSIVEYESALIGLRSVDPRNQIQVQQELRQICQYACARKESSKAGSVLILRFFHGYYPSEIMRVLCATRKAVDDRLRLGRAEARAALDSPESLAFIGSQTIPEVMPTRFARFHEDFLGELRQTIFQARQHDCLSKADLDVFYRRAEASPTAEKLAHIVSCPECLDEINHLLNLPLLAERFSPDTIGNEPRSKDGPGGDRGATGGDATGSVRRWKRDCRDTFEHKPQELCISVNGYLQGSQKVSSEISEQSLTVDLQESISFVEVFSEQGIRLLLMNVRDLPPEGPGEQRLRIPLSDERTLELALRFSSPWPTVDVRYRDPALTAEVSAQRVDSETASSSPASERATRRLARMRSLLPRFGKVDFSILTRPKAVTAIVSVLALVTAFYVYRRSPSPPVIATNLLARAAELEQAQAARTDQILHRTISLEEKSSTGALVARRRIEIWLSGERGITARRLYDENGALVAGDWRRTDGVQTLYHHGTRPQLQLGSSNPAIRNLDDVWQLGLTAKEFTALIGNAESRVQETTDSYLILVESRFPDSGIVKATLKLSKADLHPIEQTLVVQENNQAREFSFVETSFERRPPGSVAPAVFEPDAEFLSSTAAPAARSVELESANAKPNTAGSAAAPVVATPALEVEVLQLLSRAGADLGEQINVSRTSAGQLQVQGVIDTPERKAEILNALRPVAANPAVHIDISTVAEAVRRQRQNGARPQTLTVEGVQPVGNSIPADADLRRYLNARGVPADQLDDEVQRFSNQMMGKSRQAMYEAAAMKKLAERFSPEDLRSLDSDAKSKWLGLIRQHARAFQTQSARVREELGPVFGLSDSGSDSVNAINDTDALIRAVTHLFELSAANYNAIRSAFSLSNNSSTSAKLKSPQFWRAMREAESLAETIANSR